MTATHETEFEAFWRESQKWPLDDKAAWTRGKARAVFRRMKRDEREAAEFDAKLGRVPGFGGRWNDRP